MPSAPPVGPDDIVDPRAKAPRSRRPPVGGVLLFGIAIAMWWPAFTLGAWGDLFFDQLLTVWVASTVMVFVVLLQPRPYPRRALQVALLLIPTLWLVLTFVPADDDENFGVLLGEILALTVALLGIPFTIWTLARLVWPEFGSQLGRGRRLVAILALVVTTVGSYALGANQEHFLTCEDFSISGNSEPPGCVHEPTPAPAP
nr:hypothetical protein [Agromyces seonyuensis]